MKDRIAKSVFWIVWSRGGVQAINLLSTLFVARLLAPADYGLMAMAGVWIFIMGLISEMGLGAAIVQFGDMDRPALNTCFWLSFITAWLSYVALFIAAPGIERLFSMSGLSDVLRVVALGLPLMALRVVPENLMRQRLALDKLSKAEIISSIVTIPVVVALAWENAGVWALVAAFLVQQIVVSVVIFSYLGWLPGLILKSSYLKQMIHFSLATLGSRLCWAVYQQSDNFIIGKILGDAALGSYSMGKQLATMAVEKLGSIVMQLATPVMAEVQKDRSAIARYFLRSVRLMSSIALPVSIGTIFVADDFVLFALGQKWVSVTPIVKVLSIYSIFYSLSVLLFPVLMSCNRVPITFKYTFGQLIIMPPMILLGASWYGIVGAAIAWTTAYPIALIWLLRKALNEMNVGWCRFLMELRASVVATAMMGIVLVALQWFLAMLSAGAGPRLVLGISCGVISYALGMVWLSGPLVNEIKEILGWIVRPKAELKHA